MTNILKLYPPIFNLDTYEITRKDSHEFLQKKGSMRKQYELSREIVETTREVSIDIHR